MKKTSDPNVYLNLSLKFSVKQELQALASDASCTMTEALQAGLALLKRSPDPVATVHDILKIA